jgi:archaellum component FlaC
MGMKEDFDNLIEKLKTERDGIKLKAHLASMEARQEFEGAEKKWNQLKEKASEIADGTVETSEEYIAKAKIVGEELKETYKRIAKRLSE